MPLTDKEGIPTQSCFGALASLFPQFPNSGDNGLDG
jgi:hypothetical protein